MKRMIGWFAAVMMVASVAVAASAPGYHLVTTWKLGGEGGWDYMKADSDARRLYIARATRVLVVDPRHARCTRHRAGP